MRKVRDWLEGNLVVLPGYVLILSIFVLGVVGITCMVIEREELIDTLATLFGLTFLVLYVISELVVSKLLEKDEECPEE